MSDPMWHPCHIWVRFHTGRMAITRDVPSIDALVTICFFIIRHATSTNSPLSSNRYQTPAFNFPSLPSPHPVSAQRISPRSSFLFHQAKAIHPYLPAIALLSNPVQTAAELYPVAELAELSPVAELADLSPVAELAELSPVAELAELSPVAELADLSPVAELAELSPDE